MTCDGEPNCVDQSDEEDCVTKDNDKGAMISPPAIVFYSGDFSMYLTHAFSGALDRARVRVCMCVCVGGGGGGGGKES